MDPKPTTPNPCSVPPEAARDFAGVRGRVLIVLEASPRSISLSDALEQIRKFSQQTRTASPQDK